MKTALLLLTALMWTPAWAAHDESGRTPAGFASPPTQPESFGRQADNSRLYPDAAAVPALGRPSRRRTPESVLTHPAGQPVPPALNIPSPAPAAATRSSLPTRAAPYLAPLVIGTALGAGAAFLLTAARRESPPCRITFPSQTPLPPLKSPPPPLPRLPQPPPFQLSAPPAVRDSEPEDLWRAQRWWAISREEQLAIDRWAAGAERGFEHLTLADWLDAHEGEFGGVNISRLKEKLRREA